MNRFSDEYQDIMLDYARLCANKLLTFDFVLLVTLDKEYEKIYIVIETENDNDRYKVYETMFKMHNYPYYDICSKYVDYRLVNTIDYDDFIPEYYIHMYSEIIYAKGVGI